MSQKHLIVIVGPTAVGKTALSIHLAKKINTSIISADSRQFYKEINIGTAKPSIAELKEVPHHFINSHSVNDEYNVGKYETEVIALLEKLFKVNDIVLLVGGSGLYIDAVCKGLDQLPDANLLVRNNIKTLYTNEGIEGLQNLLKQLDPLYYQKVDLQNPQRLCRALEVCLTTNTAYSTLRVGKIKKRNFNIIKIGLTTSRETLYNKINQRVEQMIQQGLVEEVKQLVSLKHLNALQTVGYKELFDYLDGKIEFNHAIGLIKQNTRRYAKRQLTWFRKDEEIKWYEPNDEEAILNYIYALVA